MSLAEMQACLARIYIDDPFRKLFLLDPEQTLANYKLSIAEMNTIKHIDRTRLKHFSDTLKHKRQRLFRAAYPLLFKVANSEMTRYYDRFYQVHRAKPYQSTLNQIEDFGLFMEGTLGQDHDLPPYTADIAKYERLVALVRPSSLSKIHQDGFVVNESYGDATTSRSRPKIRPEVRVCSFNYDIMTIVEALKNGQSPGDPERGEFGFVFQPISESSACHVFSINPFTRNFLDLCDGSRNLQGLIKEWGLSKTETLGMETLTPLVREILGLNIITMSSE